MSADIAFTLIEIGKLCVNPNLRRAYALARIADQIPSKVGHLLPRG